jgi:membrane protease YdiL (CAAX protease family)
VRGFWRELRQDAGHDLRAFARNRSALLVTILLLLPWFAVMVTGRNTNPWLSQGEILGIILVYWFFTRRQATEWLTVRRPVVETALALALVLLWMLFRVGQYTSLYTLPQVRFGPLKDIYETIVPKLLEMVLLPLALWFGLRYRPRDLGLDLNLRRWLPALPILLALTVLGLSSHKPQEFWDRIVYFFLGAGLPEELLFRGILQSRVEALVKNPAWAVYLAALVFGASHLPINLSNARPEDWLSAFESAFTFQMSVGFALGYAFYRARSLFPLMVVHTLIDAAP